jgi:hypothetical protein
MREDLAPETCEFRSVKEEVMGAIEPAPEDKKGLC